MPLPQLQHPGGHLAVRPCRGHVAAVGQRLAQIDAAHGLVVGGGLRVLKGKARFVQGAVHNIIEGIGPVKEVALDFFAAQGLQDLEMLPAFHALDQGGDAHAPGHIDDIGNDDIVFARNRKILHELHIDFDQIEVQLLQQVQGGILAAEIVHPHVESAAAEPRHLPLEQFLVLHKSRFCDLDFQQAAGEAGCVHPVGDLLHHIALFKVPPGQVHRNGHDGNAQFLPALKVPQHLAHYVQVHLVHQPVFLQGMDEAGGHQEAVLGIEPTGKSLFVAYMAGHGAGNGLIIQLQPALFDGFVHMADDVLPETLLRIDFLIVVAEGGFAVAGQGLQGGAGLSQKGDDAFALREPGEPGFADDRKTGLVVPQGGVDFVQRLLHLGLIAQDAELRAGDMANIAVGEMPLQKPRRFRDQGVALGIAESVVKGAHLHQLEAAHHRAAVPVYHAAGDQRVGPADKIAHARQAGKLVDFGGVGVGEHVAFRNGGPQVCLAVFRA